MTTLSGKTALVTGSTSGIGLGIALSLAKAGANLILNGFGDASTVIASLTSGLGMFLSQSASTRKPGNEAITAPKPYSEAVFIAASNEPPTALLLPSASLPRIAWKPNTNTMRMPTSSAA